MKISVKKGLVSFVYGLIFGVGSPVPGVSAGTVAILLNVYDKFFNSINKAAAKKNLLPIIIFLLGWIAGLLSISNVMLFLFENHGKLISFTFIGLVSGCIPMIYRKAKAGPGKIWHGVAFLAALGFMFFLAFYGGDLTTNNTLEQLGGVTPTLLIWLFVACFFSSMAMLIPGVGGSLMMIVFGIYTIYIEAVATFDIVVLGVFVVSMVLGVLAGILITKKILERFPKMLYCAILGLILGSLLLLYPGFTFGLEGMLAIALAGVGFGFAYWLSKKEAREPEISLPEASPREIAHQNLARQAAAEGIVLLENDGTLPIPPGRIALYGAGAAATIKGGTGSGEVNERHSVTIREGLVRAGFEITTPAWLDEYVHLLAAKKKQFYRKFFRKAWVAAFGDDDLRINIMADFFRYPVGPLIADISDDADTCIYVIARQAGECSDRSLEKFDYLLEPDEIANIKTVAAHYRKTIIAINVGGYMDLTPLDEMEGINAVVFFCQQGMEGGNAFADVITGKISPSGCLSGTWTKKYDDIPFAREYSYFKGERVQNKIKEYYKEGIYVGYRYFDSFGVVPRYEFGYGLTYSEFKIEYVHSTVEKTKIVTSVRVINTGKYAGKKVVQLYASCPHGRLTREYQSLAAFGKTRTLQPGEAETIAMSFDFAALAGYDTPSSSFLLEAGEYILRLGSSSRQAEAVAVATLDKRVITEQCKPICPLADILDEIIPPAGTREEMCVTTEKLTIRADDFFTKKITYDLPEPQYSPKVQEWMKSLTLDDMMKCVVGTGFFSSSRKGLTAPGAAGRTTRDFVDKGIPEVIFCDGPAGLRLRRTSVITPSGKIKPADAMLEMLNHIPAIFKKWVFADPSKGRPSYQFATAFPVGMAIAQTWSVDLLERFGQAIGTEMKEFGGNYWLAPGMNIHRNPLCGRNYEYYSEDPLLSGKLAAAATIGLQSFPGCAATIKHFVANNQETWRNHSDSVVSERALREIYLRGFKTAVTEGGAKSVMTSYNLVNGTYTPNSHDLCTKVLRCEWGFNGVVMTDWLSTGKNMAKNGLALKSGNDLIMPGGKGYLKKLQADFAKGEVSEADIRRCCGNILEAIHTEEKYGRNSAVFERKRHMPNLLQS
ncbi:MAG: DUF368 domain-containing protein [Defluviitaleaceae bacterium]|nr:DUF368 domain-containing protein [Defluviitaleaceae bacterium]MCL2239006.1 DUF368 domain-containing protein [Defluviitaleaceae bacterium]